MGQKQALKPEFIVSINNIMIDAMEKRITKDTAMNKLTNMIQPVAKTTAKGKLEVAEKLAYSIKKISEMK